MKKKVISTSLVFYFIVISIFSCYAKNEETKPNFVLIIGDDISVNDFGCYGNKGIRTPNIDKLASSGMRLTNAYLTTSQCSPTRCSIITGRYPHNTGAPELHTGLPEGQVMFPALLRNAGYYTAAAGKWHMGDYPKIAFDTITDSKPGGEETWVNILKGRDKNKPFFMWFASHDAHRPWQFDKADEPHSPEDVAVPTYLIDTDKSRDDMAKYYDEVQRLDRYVGKVVNELERQGILDNTLIIFIADNGRPFPRCKMRLYDSGIKTPFIIRWNKGLKNTNSVSKSLISVIDIAPTILEIAGLEISETFQGVSFSPILENSESTIRNYVFAEHNWHSQIAHERMVRFENFVYIKNAHPQLPQIMRLDSECPQEELRELDKQGTLTSAQKDPLIEPRPAEELFDLNNDPNQINNLVNDSGQKKTLEHLRDIVNEWQLRTGDTTPSLEEATPDRHNRWTGERIHKGWYPKGGIIPGQTSNATKINDSGPR